MITRAPHVERLPGIVRYDPGVAFDLLFMESRLYRATLLAMLFAIDGQQPLTCKASIALLLEQAAIGKIVRVFHQHVAHMFRAEQEDSRSLSYVDRCHVAIGALQLLQKA